MRALLSKETFRRLNKNPKLSGSFAIPLSPRSSSTKSTNSPNLSEKEIITMIDKLGLKTHGDVENIQERIAGIGMPKVRDERSKLITTFTFEPKIARKYKALIISGSLSNF